MQPESIQRIKQNFRDEWLAIHVTKTNRYSEPAEGILLAHSKSHDEIWDIAENLEGDIIMITFTGPVIPEGQEVVVVHGYVSI
jgi:hypothetical protein